MNDRLADDDRASAITVKPRAAAQVDDVEMTDVRAALEREVFVDDNPITGADVVASRSGIGALTAEQRRLNAVAMIRERLPGNASPQLQKQVVRILDLMEHLPYSRNADARMAMAELALHRILAHPQDVTLATEIGDTLRRRLGGRVGLAVSRIRIATPPHVDVVLGMFTSLLLFGVLMQLGGTSLLRSIGLGAELIPDASLKTLLWLGLVGAFGSAVSMLVRLNDFAELDDTNAFIHFLNGLFKPVIGLAAAGLAYALIKGGLLPLNIGDDQAYAFIALAFVAGFSERMVKDLVSIAERSVRAAGERGVEAQRVGAATADLAGARAEIDADLSGKTEVTADDIYADFDLDEIEETVQGSRAKP